VSLSFGVDGRDHSYGVTATYSISLGVAPSQLGLPVRIAQRLYREDEKLKIDLPRGLNTGSMSMIACL